MGCMGTGAKFHNRTARTGQQPDGQHRLGPTQRGEISSCVDSIIITPRVLLLPTVNSTLACLSMKPEEDYGEEDRSRRRDIGPRSFRDRLCPTFPPPLPLLSLSHLHMVRRQWKEPVHVRKWMDGLCPSSLYRRLV